MIGTVQADTFGYDDAKKAIAAAGPGGNTRSLRPSAKARQRFCGTDWTMYLLGWKTAMAEKRAKDTKWEDQSAAKKGTRVPAKAAGKGSSSRSQAVVPVEPASVPSSPPQPATTGSPEWSRGYNDFSPSVGRHCAPSSDNAQDWADYMEGWATAERDWENGRSFPESVRVQISKTAFIEDVEDGKKYHLQSTAVVVADRMDRSGVLEFDWEGARYSVWPGPGVSFLE